MSDLIDNNNVEHRLVPLLRRVARQKLPPRLHRQVLHEALQQILLHPMHPYPLQPCKLASTQQFEENNYRKDTWICYFCQDTCNCFKCKNQELNEMERKNKRRSKSNTQKPNEESADLQSASNFSLSNNINSLSANNPNTTANPTLQNSSNTTKIIDPSI